MIRSRDYALHVMARFSSSVSSPPSHFVPVAFRPRPISSRSHFVPVAARPRRISSPSHFVFVALRPPLQPVASSPSQLVPVAFRPRRRPSPPLLLAVAPLELAFASSSRFPTPVASIPSPLLPVELRASSCVPSPALPPFLASALHPHLSSSTLSHLPTSLPPGEVSLPPVHHDSHDQVRLAGFSTPLPPGLRVPRSSLLPFSHSPFQPYPHPFSTFLVPPFRPSYLPLLTLISPSYAVSPTPLFSPWCSFPIVFDFSPAPVLCSSPAPRTCPLVPLSRRKSEKERRSSYAPQACVRYDGVYHIERCWRKKSKVVRKGGREGEGRGKGGRGEGEGRERGGGREESRGPYPSTAHTRSVPLSSAHTSPGRKLPQVAELKQAVDVTERTGPPAWDWIEEKQQWGWVRAPPACTKPIGGTSTAWRSAKRLAVGSTAEAAGVRYDGVYRIERCWRKKSAVVRRGKGGGRACNDGVYLIECCWRKKSAVVRWRGGVWSDDVGDSPGRKLPQVAELKQAVDVTKRTGPPAWDWIVHGWDCMCVHACTREEKQQWGWVRPPPACTKPIGGTSTAWRSAKRLAHSFCLACLQQRFHGQADTRDRSKTAGRSLRAQKIVKQCPAARCTADIADVLSRLQVNHDMADLIAMLLAETNAPDAEEGEDAGEGGEEDGEEGAEGEEDEEDEGKGSRGKDEGKERDGSMEGAGEEGVKEEGGSTGVQVLNAIGAAGSGGGSGEGKAKGAQGEVDGGREGSVDGGKAGGGGALSATSEALVACSSLAAASEGLREVMRACPCETCWCWEGERGGVGGEWCFVRRGRGGKNGALCEGGEGGRMVLCAKGERGGEWCFVRRGRGGKNGALCEGGEGGRMVLSAKGERGEE
ncbi:unnamed protein product [Closterium sp. NIES-65]|nr:unnamed protein product [Closterium sp. NIES-65]